MFRRDGSTGGPEYAGYHHCSDLPAHTTCLPVPSSNQAGDGQFSLWLLQQVGRILSIFVKMIRGGIEHDKRI
jgi:hypothetical protein